MSESEELKQQLNRFRSDFDRLRNEVGKVIVGLDGIVEGALTALIAGGHVLLEDFEPSGYRKFRARSWRSRGSNIGRAFFEYNASCLLHLTGCEEGR